MNMRFIAALGIGALVCGHSHIASAGTLLAGFHAFADSKPLGRLTKGSADEGVFAASSSVSYRSGSTSTGGSTDNWYGPDSAAQGGHITNQTPFGTAANQPYLNEVEGGNARSEASYASKAAIPSNIVSGGTQSTADGRINSLNGTDISVMNNSNASYRIDRILFDSFLGGVKDNSKSLGFTKFPVTITRNDGSSSTSHFRVTEAYAGVNSLSGEAANQSLANPNLVNNRVDYGVGANYLDYVVDLGGFILRPGESFSLGFNVVGYGVAQGDNFALIGTHLPEPMTALAFGGLFGLGLLDRRRRARRRDA